jgi:hypothetical protein
VCDEASSPSPTKIEVTFSSFKLYVATDLTLLPKLKNAVMDELIRRDNNGPYQTTPTLINYVYRNTPPGSHLRRFIVETYMDYSITLRSAVETYCSDFLAELGDDEPGGTRQRMIPFRERCDYHEHEGDDKCK